jgi:WD40 repeat protein
MLPNLLRFLIITISTVLWINKELPGQAIQTSPTPILDVAWHPDGDIYAIIDSQGTLSIIDAAQPTPIFYLQGTTSLVAATVAWNTTGSRLAVGIGYQVYLWDTTTWQLSSQFIAGDPDGFVTPDGALAPIPEGIASITWGNGDHYVISGSINYLTTIWDDQETETIYQMRDRSGGGPGRVWLGNGWLGDGRTKRNIFSDELVTLSPDEFQYSFGAGGGTNATQVHPNLPHIALGTEFGYLLILDLNTMYGIQGFEVTDSLPPTPRRALTDIAWSSDGNFVAAVSRDGEIYIANLISGNVATVTNVSAQLNAVDWNPTTNEIIYAGVDNLGAPILNTVDVSGIAGVPFIAGTLDITHTAPAAGLTLTDEGLFLAEGATIGDQFAVRLSAAPAAPAAASNPACWSSTAPPPPPAARSARPPARRSPRSMVGCGAG